MALDILQYANFTGPAFPEPFVRFELEKELNRLKLLPKTTAAEGRKLRESWEVYRRRLRELIARGGAVRVRHHVLEPLVAQLGYAHLEVSPEIETREGREPGGHVMISPNGMRLRVWSTALEEDLDAPSHRGRAYRFSHARMAQRVLLAAGERVGLLTNGVELRIVLSDPARPDSQISIPIDPHWKRSRDVPDTYRLLVALASPAGVQAVPELVDKARLQQTRVTSELRLQARQAIERFVQEVLDHPENREHLATFTDAGSLAHDLWHEGLITIYRLLFILKLESSDDPARSFSFASTSLWRNSFSPSVALARYARAALDQGVETGHLLEEGLRALFRMFAQGLQCTELHIAPMGGALFGTDATPLLSELHWGEHAVAHLLDRLLWTPKRRGTESRERVHYGPMDVEDLGRVYEALLELEPGITTEPMCRLRRQKLEVVVPVAQGERYRPAKAMPSDFPEDAEADDGDVEEEEEEDTSTRVKKTKVDWIEEIPPGRFYLRVGLGRKASGSYYTPHAFVRFLVQETLGPQVAERSPEDDPKPNEILKLKVLDPAMGSGHFLVEACRFLGEKLYEACRLCDERALQAEHRAEQVKTDAEREAALAEAVDYQQRIIDLPDPDDELVRYLPSRAPEGEESGLSQKKAEALCRRLVAVHCLYGVDKNPLAVELAKLALWLESHAEGLPLTFLDHRLVLGDSLTGPFFDHLLTYPGSQEPMDDLLTQGLCECFTNTLLKVLKHMSDLEASVGASLAEIEAKAITKACLDRALAPFKIVAAAWAGGAMLGDAHCDDPAYARLVRYVSDTGDLPDDLSNEPRLLQMLACGLGVKEVPSVRLQVLELLASGTCISALPYELAFPEVFFPCGELMARVGYDAVMGNPPWEKLRVERRDVIALIDPRFLEGREVAGVGTEHELIESLFSANTEAIEYEQSIYRTRAVLGRIIRLSEQITPGVKWIPNADLYQFFLIRSLEFTAASGCIGLVLGGGIAKSPTEAFLRKHLFERHGVRVFAHFFNLRQLFGEASSRISFVVAVLDRAPRIQMVKVGFDLVDPSSLPIGSQCGDLDTVSLDEILRTESEGDDVSFSTKNRPSMSTRFARSDLALESMSIRMSEGLHRTGNKRFIHRVEDILPGCLDARNPNVLKHLLSKGYACLYAGRSIDAFDSLPEEKSGKWNPQVDLVISLNCPRLKRTLDCLTYYRLAWRNTCGHIATNERSARACILPPMAAAAGSLLVELAPAGRANILALVACAVINTFAFDVQVRQVVQTNFNKAILAKTTWPILNSSCYGLLSHFALRLICNQAGYAPLWREQLGNVWREPKPLFTWPVMQSDDERWVVRAAIDAVVADAYGLSREQYAHVLSTFSHRSYARAPELCLACYDELKAIGVEAFTRKYDSYWDIPLNENLPEPVVDLPIAEAELEGNDHAASRQEQLLWLAAEPEASQYQPSTRRHPLPSAASHRTSMATTDDEPYELLKLLLKKQGVMTSSGAQDFTGLDAADLRHMLKRLVDEGIAVQEGQGRGTRYRHVER